MRVELGGGLRTADDLAAALEVADVAILGTAAIEDPAFLAAAYDVLARADSGLDRRAWRPGCPRWLDPGGGNGACAIARSLESVGVSALYRY